MRITVIGLTILIWWCYIVRCADDTLYTGITNDLEKRVAAHNAGSASKYTRARRPVKLAYREEHADRSAASKREAAIKRLSRKTKLELVASLRKRRKIK